MGVGQRSISIQESTAKRLEALREIIPRTRPSRGMKPESYDEVVKKILSPYEHGATIEQVSRIMHKLNIIKHERELTWEDVTWLIEDLLQSAIQDNIQ